jgi:hypothetical protein
VFSEFVPPLSFFREGYTTPIEIVRGAGDGVIFSLIKDRVEAVLGIRHAEEIEASLMQRYNAFAIENQDGISERQIISPPSVPVIASAYREITGVKEKDLESSVLWRGLQAVHSAMRYFKEHDRSKIHTNAMDAFIKERNDSHDLYRAGAAAIANAFAFVHLYHPVIVTQSKLWRTNGSELEPVNQVRFWQIGSSGQPFRWVDIVQLDFFLPYATSLTEYYAEAIVQRGFSFNQPSLSRELLAHLSASAH